MEVGVIVKQGYMMGQINKKILEKEGMIGTMDRRTGSRSSFSNKKCRHPMGSKHNECVPFIEYV